MEVYLLKQLEAEKGYSLAWAVEPCTDVASIRRTPMELDCYVKL